MNYSEIKPLDIANGTGVRVSLFVSGCRNHCKGCFNPATWDFRAGKPFDEKVERRILQLLKPDHVVGLTILGGEPFEPENQRDLLPFVRRVRSAYPDKTIWAYSGCVLDRDMCAGGRVYCGATDELLSLIDVLVDGPFIEARKDILLRFRGSDNQRIIDMKATRERGEIVLCKEPRKSPLPPKKTP